MKKFLGISVLTLALTLTTFADGEMGTGTKTCSSCRTTPGVITPPEKTETPLESLILFIQNILNQVKR